MTTFGILEGSARMASLSRAVARSAQSLAPEGVTCRVLPNPVGLPQYNQDVLDAGIPAPVAALAAELAICDAVLIVTPEYNWSIPGSLKNAIDWLSRLKPNPLEGKPVAIWTVSPGQLGGARVHEGLRHVLHSQDMRVMAKPEVQLGLAAGKVDVAASAVTDEASRNFLRDHLAKFETFVSAHR